MNDEHCALTDNNSGNVEKPVLMLTNMQLLGTHNQNALKMLHRNWFTFKFIFLEVLSNGINHKHHPSKKQHTVQNAVYGKMGLKIGMVLTRLLIMFPIHLSSFQSFNNNSSSF